MYDVEVTSAARKELKKLPKKKQQRFFGVIEFLKEFPYSGKKLSGELQGYYSVRLWPYRVIYIADRKKKKVIVVAVKHRRESYR